MSRGEATGFYRLSPSRFALLSNRKHVLHQCRRDRQQSLLRQLCQRETFAGLACSSARVICHCCAMDRILFTSQYRTRPEGKKKKKTLKATGMIFMTLAWTGSGGVEFIQLCTIIEMPMSTGRT